MNDPVFVYLLGIIYFFIFTGGFTYFLSLLLWRREYPERGIRCQKDKFNRLINLGEAMFLFGIILLFLTIFLGVIFNIATSPN